jgi:hypothetical protein
MQSVLGSGTQSWTLLPVAVSTCSSALVALTAASLQFPCSHAEQNARNMHYVIHYITASDYSQISRSIALY